MKDFCSGCKSFQEIAWTEEETCRAFCFVCVRDLPPTSEQIAMAFLMATIPFKPGDRVECRTAGGTPVELYDGIGVVEEMFMDIEHGATAVYPTWRVRMVEKAYPQMVDECIYTECCLKLVEA